MGGINWTKEQEQVITLRERNLLVSAAAGSGKTATLVERILTYLCRKEHPGEIDHLLVLTFTKAAAAEMRERIGKAIEERLEKDPENVHLQRQSALVHNAQITTIHSFYAWTELSLNIIFNKIHNVKALSKCLGTR